MKKLYILFAVSLCSFLADAQQDVLLSQYMFNPLVLNPGYAGSKDYIMATAVYRKQWVGWGEGAPETGALSIHSPLKNKNFGIGFNVVDDHLGVTNRLDAYIDGAYHLQLNPHLHLGLGLQAGITNYSFSKPSLVWDENDPLYISGTNSLLPNVGVGAFLYADKFYVGLSVPHILDYDSSKVFNVATAGKFEETKHYFATAGYVFDANPDVVVKPSILMKYVPHAPAEFDFNVNVMFVQTFWLGASFRTNDAIVGIVEIQLSKKLRVGYSYDFTTTDIKTYSSGSHEVMLEYDFGYELTKMKTPRYF